MEAGPPVIVEAQEKARGDGFRRITLRTARGRIETRLYAEPDAASATLLVGGSGGGFDSPACNLYGVLGAELPAAGIACLRLRYRDPTDLDGSVYDAKAGLRFLVGQVGAGRLGVVGHSLGGAVAITAGVAAQVTTVVTLSTQSYGTETVDDLAPRPILLIHGTADEVLPPGCSVVTWRRARPPKELRLINGARHVLDEAAGEVHDLVRAWLVRHLGSAPS